MRSKSSPTPRDRCSKVVTSSAQSKPGRAPIGERLLSGHQNENALFGFDSIPFLATSFDDSAKLWDAAKPSIEKLLAEQNLTLLYAVPWPPQGLYFKNEVNSVADMAGIKFRSYNNATSRLAELTGMLPVTIEAAEISQAFATGVAESMVSSGSTGYDRKVWESLSYFYEVDAWLPRNYVMVNSEVWAGVSDANKNVIQACASLAEYAGNWRAKEYTGFTLQGLRDGGMTVGPASDQMVGELKEIGVTMTNEWLEGGRGRGQSHRRCIQLVAVIIIRRAGANPLPAVTQNEPQRGRYGGIARASVRTGFHLFGGGCAGGAQPDCHIVAHRRSDVSPAGPEKYFQALRIMPDMRWRRRRSLPSPMR